MVLKVGRNQPCPCGSGKKYKKCHGSFSAASPPQAAVSKSFIEQMVQRHEAVERIRHNQQGFGRPVVSFRAFDRQIVAVGDTIYHSADWKTFPDFLAHYAKTVLGVEWGNAELKKPLTERHPIMQWYDAICRYQAETIKEKGKVATCAMTGAVACYLGTAYNLYLLKHNVELQERLIKRLKNPDQFQGAYHELIVANILIRAGFDLTLEDETDGETKHCEFAAVSKRTRKRYWVEAKMRGVKGLLGKTERDGGSDDDPLSRLVPHLNLAFNKPAQDDRLIFIDINGESGEIKDGAPPEWVDRAVKRLERYEQKGLPEGETAYVFVTNMPFHRSLNDPPLIVGIPFGVGVTDFNRPANYRLSEAYRLKQKHIDAYDIGEALAKYPQMPSTFDGSLPSEAFYGDKGRVLIGETYHFDGIGGGGGLIAKVTSASVNEAEKKVYVGTDSGSILSYPMSDEALADYRANADAYFGRVEPTATKPLTNIYDLFEWLMKTHEHLGKDVLLRRLAQVPGIETVTDDELRAIYCEGLAGSFQKSIDAKKNTGTPVVRTKEAPLATVIKAADF